MKIKDIKVYAIQTPLEVPFYFSQGWVHVRSAVIVEVISESGESGFGECLCHGMQPPQMAEAIIKNCFIPRVLGRSIFDTEVLWEELYNISRPFGQQGIIVNALSGIDIALWDLKGKVLKQSIANLIGGSYRTSVQAYATGFYRVENKKYPEESVLEAQRHLEKGFLAMKLKAGFGVKEDIEYIKTLRQRVGFDVKLMVDFNCAYNQTNARKIIKELENEKIEWFEELLVPEDISGYKSLRNLSSSAISAGENIFGKRNFIEWMYQGALDIYQPDLCSCGGFTEYKKILALAQATNSTIIPHVWGSGIGLAASLQLMTAISPNPLVFNSQGPLLEYDQSDHPFRSDLINNSIIMEQGIVNIPTGPGLGIDINRDVLEKYKIIV